MKILFEELNIRTTERTELVDMTDQVERFVSQSSVESGICLVHALHSTAAIVVNEYEDGLLNDIVRKVNEEFPKGAGWSHDRIDDNADAHLASSFIGTSRTLPVTNHKLVRGSWQDIFLLELDGPRDRKVMVEILGE